MVHEVSYKVKTYIVRAQNDKGINNDPSKGPIISRNLLTLIKIKKVKQVFGSVPIDSIFLIILAFAQFKYK